VVLSCFFLGVLFTMYCMCSHGNGKCKWCRENVEGGVVAFVVLGLAVACIVVLSVWVFN
jgi:hypothetical protein